MSKTLQILVSKHGGQTLAKHSLGDNDFQLFKEFLSDATVEDANKSVDRYLGEKLSNIDGDTLQFSEENNNNEADRKGNAVFYNAVKLFCHLTKTKGFKTINNENTYQYKITNKDGGFSCSRNKGDQNQETPVVNLSKENVEKLKKKNEQMRQEKETQNSDERNPLLTDRHAFWQKNKQQKPPHSQDSDKKQSSKGCCCTIQ